MFHAETGRAAQTAQVITEKLRLFSQGRRELGFVDDEGREKFTSGAWASEKLETLIDAYGNPILVTHADTAEQMADALVHKAHGRGHAPAQRLRQGEAVVVNMQKGTELRSIFRYFRRG